MPALDKPFFRCRSVLTTLNQFRPGPLRKLRPTFGAQPLASLHPQATYSAPSTATNWILGPVHPSERGDQEGVRPGSCQDGVDRPKCFSERPVCRQCWSCGRRCRSQQCRRVTTMGGKAARSGHIREAPQVCLGSPPRFCVATAQCGGLSHGMQRVALLQCVGAASREVYLAISLPASP